MPKLRVEFPSGSRAYSAPSRQVESLIADGEASPIYNRKGTRLLGCRLLSISTGSVICEANRTISKERLGDHGEVWAYQHLLLNKSGRLTNPKGWDQPASKLAAHSSAELKRGPLPPPKPDVIVGVGFKSIDRNGQCHNLQRVPNV